jgi:signal transduction histidine kinase
MALAYHHSAAPEAPAAFHEMLVEICQAMGSSLELREVLATLLERTLHEMRAQQGSILLFNSQTDRLEMLAAQGLPTEMVSKGYIPRKGSIAEWVIEHNQPLIINDTPTTSHYKAMDARRKIYSAMCVPLRARGKVIGTINMNRTEPEPGLFVEPDLNTMVILAQMSAIFIENSRLHESNLKAERLVAVGQTVAGISHCIKNVLTGIKGGMSLMEMAAKAEKWEMLLQGMGILKRNLDRLGSIVLDMLDYSKERVPVRGPVAVYSLLEEVAGTVQPDADKNHVVLHLEADPQLPNFEADGQQLFRCLLNLAQNAVDAMHETGGAVFLRAEYSREPTILAYLKDKTAPEAIVLRVADTGPGVSEENRAVLFEPFFSTKGSKGTGLGLAVTKKIIEEHGGQIVIETTAPDSAVFAIILPTRA